MPVCCCGKKGLPENGKTEGIQPTKASKKPVDTPGRDPGAEKTLPDKDPAGGKAVQNGKSIDVEFPTTSSSDSSSSYAREGKARVTARRGQEQHIDADGEQLEWLNRMMRSLWPHVNTAVKSILVKEIAPTLNKSLPAPLNTFGVEEFHLGDEPPILGPISAYAKKKQDFEGFELDIFVSWRPRVDIKLKIMGLVLGLKSLCIEGTVSIVLRPLMGEIPVVGGVQIFMINPPEIDIDFTGAANVIDLPLIATTIRGILNTTISDALVLPNRLFVPIADETKVDMSRMQFPRPEAVIRLQLHAGRDLMAKDFSLLGKPSSDPYVMIKIGNRTMRSATIKKNVNPVWENEIYDFFMFNKRQIMRVHVFDEDIDADDSLGKSVVQIEDIACQGRADLELEENGETCGHLELQLHTLKCHKLHSMKELPFADVNGLHVGLITIQCRSIRGIPKKYDRRSCYVTFELEDPKDIRRTVNGTPKVVPALVDDSVPHAMQAMIENLSMEKGMSVKDLAHLAQYPPSVIQDILKRRPSYDTVFNFGCHFLIKDPLNVQVKIKIYVKNQKNAKNTFAEITLPIKTFMSPTFNNHIEIPKSRKHHGDSQATEIFKSAINAAQAGVNVARGAATRLVKGFFGGNDEPIGDGSPLLSPKLGPNADQFAAIADDSGAQGTDAGVEKASPDATNGLTNSPNVSTRLSPMPITGSRNRTPGTSSAADTNDETMTTAQRKKKEAKEKKSLEDAWDEQHKHVNMEIGFSFFSLQPIVDQDEIDAFYNEDEETSSESEAARPVTPKIPGNATYKLRTSGSFVSPVNLAPRKDK